MAHHKEETNSEKETHSVVPKKLFLNKQTV